MRTNEKLLLQAIKDGLVSVDYDCVRGCSYSRMEIKELIDLYIYRGQVEQDMMSYKLTEKGEKLLEEILKGK